MIMLATVLVRYGPPPSAAEDCVPSPTNTCKEAGSDESESFGATNATHLQMSYRTVSRQDWVNAPIAEKDGMLTSFGEIVMANDEIPYMRALAKQVVSGSPNGA